MTGVELTGEFSRLAIVNRGEPAMRVVHAVREYNAENGLGIQTIAVFTEPDRGSMFVRQADEAWFLGPATFVDESDGTRQSTYLDYQKLEEALLSTAADAVWVGWGFVAEHARFADLCRRLGIVFVGPSADVMRQLGDKITSKQLAESADVAVAPWSNGAVDDVQQARLHADRLGYPLMIKATAGGGGRGIRRIDSDDDLEDAFESAQSEASKSFGDPTLFLERRVAGARHIEVQIVGDHLGTVWALGVRDCSVQRRNQKIVEESPSPALTPQQDVAIRAAAARLGAAVGYQNAGTVEFLYDPDRGEFWFMEVNARLQVEHPVTELTTGVDLVKLQLDIARGHRLEGDPPPSQGHAIEVRLNAEDPDNAFAPAPGDIEAFRLPTGPGLRIDTGVEEGDSIASDFDSMIAKIISYGRNRSEALARLRRALGETTIAIRNGTTNKAFLLELLGRNEVIRGEVDVGWLDRMMAHGEHLTRRHAEMAVLLAAVNAYESEVDVERAQFFASARRGRPEVGEGSHRSIELQYLGRSYRLEVYRLGTEEYRIDVGRTRVEMVVRRLGKTGKRVICNGETFRATAVRQGVVHLIEVEGVPHRVSADQGGVVRAPAPAVVVSVTVAEGDEVTAGSRLAVVEAMKMETSIVAEFAGRVRQVLVRDNQQVGTGAPLMMIEPAGGEGRVEIGPVLDFARFAGREDAEVVHAACRHRLQDVRRVVLGFDVDATDLARVVGEVGLVCDDSTGDAALEEFEVDILTIFVDVASLFQRAPLDVEEEYGELERRSTEEYLFTYLRDLDARGEHLPPSFLAKLERALAHYGVTSLDRTPELESALFRIAKSHQQMLRQVSPILSVLEARLDRVRRDAETFEPSRELIGRIIAESRGRFPAVHDVAREVHYRVFDIPFLEEVRGAAYQEAAVHLAHLDQYPDAPDRSDHIAALVDCPQPMLNILSAGFTDVEAGMRQAMLEIMMRRYYRERDLENVRCAQIGGLSFAGADYEFEGERRHILTTHCDYESLGTAAAIIGSLLVEIPPDDSVVIDFYLWRPGPMPEEAAMAAEFAAVLDEAPFGGRVARVVIAVTGPEGGAGMSSVRHFTFRSGDDGFHEDILYRALHPMMGERLELWRLQNFDIERLPSVEDLYLFRGVARDNPSDERLFALAEVRDLTPVTDETGRTARLPGFERMFMEALVGIRRFQARRPSVRRLHWNRVFLYVWPRVTQSPDELAGIVQQLAPATEGLGLEKVAVYARLVAADDPAGSRAAVFEFTSPGGGELSLRLREPAHQPLLPLDEYTQKVVRLRRRGLVYPFELVRILAPGRDESGGNLPPGEFVEYDLDAGGRLVPVDRPPGGNESNIVAGVIRNYTPRYPEGMARVILLGDPSKGMGNLAEPECTRIIAAIDLAESMGLPLEWFAVSAGALISMDSGTENMDWIALVLRRIIEFTQNGGEINVVVTGINVGAQPYWNAEATMLMHTKGVLIMAPVSAMVLTGKQALDYSGGVSAEDNQGIGGYERIMGPNGQAQYFAKDINDACRVLLQYYDHSFVAPGERFPRRAPTTDPPDRDVRSYPHGGEFETVGGIFSDEQNPGRKKPFDVRKVMQAVVDQDHAPLERWFGMEDAEIAVVWDAHVGGFPISLIGLESRPLYRTGFIPAYGPDQWTAGTLFPLSSKKVARAINAASGSRPVVVLANLSGFDGSPESMRKLQLEYGAEIGRAVVNFDGPMVFCVISRYHGGAFVVFSNALNDNMEVAALEGTHASVIGGAPAAAVVFAREVQKRTDRDPRVVALEDELAGAEGADKARLRAGLERLRDEVHSEKLGEVADEFDDVHSVYRAQEMGSVHSIIPPAGLRRYVIDAVERGITKLTAPSGEG